MVFLDYDGTLTPIVSRPEEAVLSESMREILRRLVAVWPTTVVSGRSRPDVAARVGVTALGYAGTHGFDISIPGPAGLRLEIGRELAPVLATAAERLRMATAEIPGALVEEKGLAVALHYRLVQPARVPEVERAFEEIFASCPGLRRASGKMVLELRPALDWDKGQAILWLLDRFDSNALALAPVYVGDDLTDEDAFEVLRDRGITVLVTDVPRPTAARYSLRDVAEVKALLTLLTGLKP